MKEAAAATGGAVSAAPALSSAPMKLLLIEDDREAAQYVAQGLTESGYTVDQAGDGAEGLALAAAGHYDLIIADRMLPYLDGLAVIRALRAQGVATRILILSALAQVDDRVKGLRAGGDDYLTKPFAFAELLARIEALLRRGGSGEALVTLKVADLEMDLVTRRVTRAGRPVELTAREFRLLEYLMRHAGQVVTRTMLLEGVWDLHFDPQTNVIDVHVSRLRQAVDKGFDHPLIQTVRGAGYLLGLQPG
jgi:two-component system OmpR family response regulator